MYQYYLRLLRCNYRLHWGSFFKLGFFLSLQCISTISDCCIVTIAYTGEASSSCLFSLSSVYQYYLRLLRCNYRLHWGSLFKLFFSFSSVYQYYLRLLHCNYRLHWGSLFKLFFSFSSVYQYYLRLLRCNYRLHWGSFFKLGFFSLFSVSVLSRTAVL